MGRVRSHNVKSVAKDLVAQFPSRFTGDFDFNKQVVDLLTNVSSRKLRNKVAGYVTHLVRLTQSSEGNPKGKPQKQD